MALESPAFASQNSTFGAEITRRAIASLLQRGATVGSIAGGILSSTDCQISAGTGMAVNVSVGEAWIPGSSSSTQGGYYGRVSSTTTNAIATSDPTNPRIDRVCLQVVDKAYAGAADSFSLTVVTGTPSAGATLSNLTGAGSPPASSLTLGYVLVPAGSSSVTNANISNVATVVCRTQYGGQAVAVITGTDASKPAASAANAGELYQATDSGALYFSDGSNLRTMFGSRGAVSIATSQSTSSTTFTTLATPDQVTNVVLPTNGLIAVWFQATWSCTVAANNAAAIFLGSNQIVVAGTGAGAPVLQSVLGSGTTAQSLATCPTGLVSNGSSYSGDVTTGQILGSGALGSGSGGPCYIFAAAGTYTVSVQFKASGGTTTVSNRTLRVQALPFA